MFESLLFRNVRAIANLVALEGLTSGQRSRSIVSLVHPVQSDVRNRLLRALSADDFALLQPSLEWVDLPKGRVIVEAGVPFDWVVFPEDGLVSVVNRAFNGRQLEVGLFGRDGMGSTACVLGCDTTPHAIFMQVAGNGYGMPAGALQRAMSESQALTALLLRYVQTFMVQVAQTALSNGTGTIEQRLARWLLMVHDRIAGDELQLTHEFLSIMLGVRRTGVTLAIHMLEGAQTIKARRGIVAIVDRDKLIGLAGDGYGPAEAEYERLLGGAD